MDYVMNEAIKTNESNCKLFAPGEICECKCNEEGKESQCL